MGDIKQMVETVYALQVFSSVISSLLFVAIIYGLKYIRSISRWINNVDQRLSSVEVTCQATVEMLGKNNPWIYQRISELQVEAKTRRKNQPLNGWCVGSRENQK